MLQKRKFMLLILSLLVLSNIALVVIYFGYKHRTPASAQVRSVGQMVQNGQSDGKKTVSVQGDNIIIYKDEVEQNAARYASAGMEDGEERALQTLLEREALYYEAVRQGYSATDEEVKAAVRDSRRTVERSNGYPKFLTYLEELDMTPDEYWENQREPIRKELVKEKYLDPIYKDFIQDETGSAKTLASGWQDHVESIVRDIIKQDRVIRIY